MKHAPTPSLASSLQSVAIDGHLHGLLLHLRMHQQYHNLGDHAIEVVYTFPLPFGATLLGLHAEIDGQRLQGTVLAKKEASQRYEQALSDGDTPIMVERSASGLYSANLGHLRPGESARIEIEFAHLLRLEQDQIRITLPTTVAPRYGDAHGGGGMAPHESVNANLLVSYPLSINILLHGAAAQAMVHSPSHAVALALQGDATLVSLRAGAFLDRDFVLLLQGLQGQSFVRVAPDGAQFAVLASFCPVVPLQKEQALLLKILVDCSGSMGGDSIQAARRALHEVLQDLHPKDQISYSRFGSSVVHDLPCLQTCTAATLKKVAQRIAETDADLGGTEMNAALLGTYALRADMPEQQAKNILLITDGEIWDLAAVVAAARQSGHRIFAIGVGSAPAESLLRDLAQQTGGACELVAPNQDIAAVIVRMARRMRTAQCQNVAVDWGQSPFWQTAVPQMLYGGDTVHLGARFDTVPQSCPVLSWQIDGVAMHSSTARIDTDTSDLLARMVAAQQIQELESSQLASGQALELALRYQLVTQRTNLLLVHVRAEDKKGDGLPTLEQVSHMQAAGWGGVGSVMAEADFSDTGFPMPVPCEPSLALESGYEIPAFLRRTSVPAPRRSRPTPTSIPAPATALELLQVFDARAQKPFASSRFVKALEALPPAEILSHLVEQWTVVLRSKPKAWAVVLQWLAQTLANQFTLSRQAERLLHHLLKDEDAGILAELEQQLADTCAP